MEEVVSGSIQLIEIYGKVKLTINLNKLNWSKYQEHQERERERELKPHWLSGPGNPDDHLDSPLKNGIFSEGADWDEQGVDLTEELRERA